jgi:2-iminobutanoate/2-iminopropanoate deaminase
VPAELNAASRKRQTGGHYSPSLRAGDFVFVAGQTPRDAERRIVGTTIEEQTAATIENLRAVLADVGARLEQVVQATVHLADLRDAPRFDATYAAYFPDNPPVRTTVGSVLNGVLVEIDVIAYVGTSAPRDSGA